LSDVALAGLVIAVPGVLLLAVTAVRKPTREALAVCLLPLSFPVGQLAVPGLPLQVVQFAAVGAVGSVWLCRLAARAGPSRPARRAPSAPFASAPVPPVLLAAGGAVLSALLSTVVAVDPAAALRLDAGYLLGLALAGTVAQSCSDARSVRIVVVAVCGAGAAVCAAGVATAPQPRAYLGGSVVDNRATGMFGQPNELGSFAAAVLVLGLALLLSLPGRHPLRLLGATAAAAGGAALTASLSRGAWIGAGLGLLVLLGLVDAGARRRLLGGLVAVAAVLVLAGVVLPRQPLLAVAGDRVASLAGGQRNPYEARSAIWREALWQWQAHPLLGVGPGGYQVLAAPGGGPLATVRPEHAHSLALTVAAEQGLVGLGAVAVAVAAGGVSVVRALRWHARQGGGGAGERELLAGAASALATVLGQGVVDYPLRNPVLVTLAWLLVGLLAAAVSTGAAAAAEPVVGALPLTAARAPSAGLADRFRRSRP